MIAWCVKCKSGIGCIGSAATMLMLDDFDDFHRLCKRKGGKMKEKESAKYTLNKNDFKKAGISALEFLSIPVGFYLTAVLGVLQLDNHVFGVGDLMPTTLTINSVITWFFMQLLGLFKRYNNGAK